MPTGVYERTKPIWNKGKKLSKKHRENISKALKSKNNPMYGVHRFGNDNPNYKHGDYGTRLIRIWYAMKARCLNLKNPHYGAKGITICPEWLDKEKGFINFKDWALVNGYNDSLEIHRKKHHLGYSPENCEWINPSKHQKWHESFKRLIRRSKKFLEKGEFKKNEFN
jgi:hypothetical protein